MRRHVLRLFPCSSFCILKCLSANVNCVFLLLAMSWLIWLHRISGEGFFVFADFWSHFLQFFLFFFIYFLIFFSNFLLFSSNLICVFLDAWRPSNWRWLFIRLPTGQGFKRMRSKRIKKMLSATLKLKTRWKKKTACLKFFSSIFLVGVDGSARQTHFFPSGSSLSCGLFESWMES